MARRRRGFLSDGSSSEDNSDGDEFISDADERADAERFRDPYGTGRKRKRTRERAREDALYGVFAEEDDDERPRRGPGGKGRTADVTKAPAFVSGKGAPKKEDLDGDGEDLENEVEQALEEEGEEGSSDESSSEDERGPARVREEEYEDDLDEAPSHAGYEGAAAAAARGAVGLGAGPAKPDPAAANKAAAALLRGEITSASPSPAPESPAPDARAGIGARGRVGASRGGIGSSRGGIGSSATAAAAPFPTPSTSTSAARQPTQKSFLGTSGGSAPSSGASTPKPVQLSAEEQRHFASLQGSFGARMMAKMGWTAGSGLGQGGKGIVTPVEAKLRPQGMGIGAGGFKEKTRQHTAEARRRGEVVSSDEEEETGRRGRKGKGKAKLDFTAPGVEPVDRSDAWRKAPKRKTKIEHKSYEEIMAESGAAPQVAPGVGPIIDATGATPREVTSSLASHLSTWAPTAETTRIPELRHNLRLIVDVARGELEGLAREGRAVQERRKWLLAEDKKLVKAVDAETIKIERLKQIQILTSELSSRASEVAALSSPLLDLFSDPIARLLATFADEYREYRLDEVVVAAITPAVRRLLADWRPLADEAVWTAELKKWRRALRTGEMEEREKENEVRLLGEDGGFSPPRRSPLSATVMTPYESLLWNVWLPKIRSAINNDWTPDRPSPAVSLLEHWAPLLPRFISDNVLDQLILPKVHKAIGDWSPRGPPLHTIVFPWLPFLGDRIEDVLGEAQRRLRAWLKSWNVRDGIPQDLTVWRDVMSKSDWDSLMLKYTVPKLGAYLRETFAVNPRQQDLDPLDTVLPWRQLLRRSIFSQLLEAEFFPKWLEILFIWLVQPKPDFDEVAQWYSFWKSYFPEDVLDLSGVSDGFKRGLDLMNQAMALGSDAPRKLRKPDLSVPLASDKDKDKKKRRPGAPIGARPAPAEITFRAIAEEYAAQNNLMFVSTGRSDERTGMPLFRVSANVDGKGGITVYVDDDAVWAQEKDGGFRPVSLEDMVKRVSVK